MSNNLFSDNWFRISTLKVSLLDSIKIYRQVFKNQLWYLLEDIHNNKHYRVKENTYKFIKSLDHNKTIDENWNLYITKNPISAPNQEEVITILTQLHSNNLLFFKNKGQNHYIYDKSKKKKNKEILQKIQGFLFIKVSIFNPDKILNSFQKLSKTLFSFWSFLIWCFSILLAIELIVIHKDEIILQTQGMLAPSNQFYC